MEVNPEIKTKIIDIVAAYKKLFPEEYRAIIDYLKEKRKHNLTKFAEVKQTKAGISTVGGLERAMFEIPASLDAMFTNQMTVEENQYRKEKETARWFMKHFKEFMSADKD